MMQVHIQETAVPALGFGTWRLSGAACREAVRDALEIGYRHVDTAAMYGNEAEVSQGFSDAGVAREEVFLTTKVWMDQLAPADVRRSAEKSLRSLATEYVDLLMIHWPTPDVPLERTLDAMVELQQEGKALHIGVSNFTVELFERAARHAPVFCNQVECHPYLAQRELLEIAHEHGALLTAYAPTARGRVLEDTVLRAIGERHGKSAVQVTLRWLLQRGCCAIPKAASPEHRRSNFDLFDFELSPDEIEEIGRLDRGQRLVDQEWAPWNW